DAGNALPSQSRLGFAAAVLGAGHQRATRRFDPANDTEEVGTPTDELVARIGPQRSGMTQKENRLEQAGLARGVVTQDACAVGIEFQPCVFDTPKILDL